MADAHIVVDPRFPVGPLDRRLFGAFVEHLGRCVYDGIYEPGHPTADADGFRTDVIDLVQELGVTTIRYPGGNFVSGYRWEDGVGPRDAAPPPPRPRLALHRDQRGRPPRVRRLARAGRRRARCSPSTSAPAASPRPSTCSSTPTSARGTALADAAHRQRPRRAATAIRMWCLGNEMDGPWQIGHSTADDYGKLAAQTAPRDAPARPRSSSWWCAAVLQRRHADVRRVGARRARAHLRRRRPTSPATPTTSEGRRHRQRSSPPASTWTASSTRSSPPPTTWPRSRQSTKTDRHLVRRVERLVQSTLRVGRPDHRHRQLAGRAAPPRGQPTRSRTPSSSAAC